MLTHRWKLAPIVLLLGLSKSLLAQPEAGNVGADALQGVRWAGPAVALEGLRGKTVIVVDYATWCPKCNKWSGDVCKQLKTFILDKPVVVLAINNDPSPANVKPYLESRDFLAPNILHGYDPNIAKRNNLPELWGYMIINPQGKMVDKGQLGAQFGDGTFAVTRKLGEIKDLGEFTVIDAQMSAATKKALWPIELGIATGSELRKLASDQKQQVDAALAKFGAKEVKQIQTLAEGDVASQFSAYDRAASLGLLLKGSEQAKEARKIAATLEADAKFKKELAAKKAYERCMKMPADSPKRLTGLKAMLKRYEGTQYCQQAQEAIDSAGAPVKHGKNS